MRARLLVIASAFALLATVLVATPASAAGTVVVTPPTGLVDLQSVTVRVSGFGQITGMCQAPAAPPVTRTEHCGGPVVSFTGPSATQQYQVRRYIHVAQTGVTVDCLDPATPCVIAAADAFDIPGTVVQAPISFAPPPPPADGGTLTVEPSSGLSGGETASVAGAGFRPAVDVEILQCPSGFADPTVCHGQPVVVRTDAAGGFSQPVTISRVVSARTPIDCALQPCVIAAAEVGDLETSLVTAPLAFRPPPPPTITLDPASGLVDGSVVAVRGSGFPASSPVAVCQVVLGQPGTCGPNASTDVLGSLAVGFTVRRLLFDPDSGASVDCADPSTPCAVTTVAAGVPDVVAPIAFAPSPAPPTTRGTVVVEPAESVEGATLTVVGTGFRPDAVVHVTQCAVPTPDPAACTDGFSIGRADPSGGFRVERPATNLLAIGGGRRIDCEASDACAIAAFEAVDPAGTIVTTPVVVHPRPTATITPPSDLRTQDVVAVHSAWWQPGSTAYVQQCGYDGFTSIHCAPAMEVTVDAAGVVVGDLTVHRFLRPVGGTIDCAEDLCAVVVGPTPGLGTSTAMVPIVFADLDPVDAQIVRLLNGSLIGDDVFGTTGDGQSQTRPVAPGRHWSFALRFQNDGDDVQDITVAGAPGADGVEIDYFYGWFDVTDLVTAGGGIRLHQVRPFEARTIVARFRVAPDAEPGTLHRSLVTATSALDADAVDAVLPGVRVIEP